MLKPSPRSLSIRSFTVSIALFIRHNVRSLCVALLLPWLFVGLHAQTAHFTGLLLGSGFYSPTGVAVDGSGNVYVADTSNNAVKEILAVNGSIPATPTIKTLASGLYLPEGVAVDGSGNVFFADSYNNAVIEILAVNGSIPATPTITTLASGFNQPTGVAVDGSGNVYVADSLNNAVKEILAVNGSIPATPAIETLGGGFKATLRRCGGRKRERLRRRYIQQCGERDSARMRHLQLRHHLGQRLQPAHMALRWTGAGTSSSPIPATMR